MKKKGRTIYWPPLDPNKNYLLCVYSEPSVTSFKTSSIEQNKRSNGDPHVCHSHGAPRNGLERKTGEQQAWEQGQRVSVHPSSMLGGWRLWVTPDWWDNPVYKVLTWKRASLVGTAGKPSLSFHNGSSYRCTMYHMDQAWSDGRGVTKVISQASF